MQKNLSKFSIQGDPQNIFFGVFVALTDFFVVINHDSG